MDKRLASRVVGAALLLGGDRRITTMVDLQLSSQMPLVQKQHAN